MSVLSACSGQHTGHPRESGDFRIIHRAVTSRCRLRSLASAFANLYQPHELKSIPHFGFSSFFLVRLARSDVAVGFSCPLAAVFPGVWQVKTTSTTSRLAAASTPHLHQFLHLKERPDASLPPLFDGRPLVR